MYTFCWFNSDVLLKNWKDSQVSILPIYKELIAAGLRIWVFRYGIKEMKNISSHFFILLHKMGLKL